ncbi:MAG: ATP adenylyltransferase [Synechococcus sp.]|nr:ATP adenylyltransferase [Synechococcus sp.]
MTSELLRKATEVTVAASASGALVPLDTTLTHLMGDGGSRFELRHLLSATPKHLRASGPKPNPFLPWDQRLEVDRIGDSHVVILNKYPVQTSHMLLITQDWQPQTGWLSMEDWRSLARIDATTTGLWFFNSGPDAGASQPHRHLQLLPRAAGERICARDDWFRRCAQNTTMSAQDPLLRSSRVAAISSTLTGETLQELYLALADDLGLGHPTTDDCPRGAYNLLLSRQWMAIVRRRREGIRGFSVNALGFAGSLLSTDASDRQWIQRSGPEALLQAVVDADG